MSGPVTDTTAWLVFDRVDVDALPASVAAQDRLVSLSAHAEAALRGRGLKACRPAFGDFAQARCVAAVRRARRQLEAGMSAEPLLVPAQCTVLREAVTRHGYAAARAWWSMRGGYRRFRVPDGRGGFDAVPNREQAVPALLRRLRVGGEASRLHAASPLAPALHSWLAATLLRLLSARRGLVLAVPSKLRFDFAVLLRDAAPGVRLATPEPSRGGVDDWKSLLACCLATLSDRSAALRVPVACSDQAPALWQAAERALAAIRDPVVQLGIAAGRDDLRANLCVVENFATALARQLRGTRVLAAVSFEANALLTTAAFRAAAEVGAQRLVTNHNTHHPPEDAVGAHVIADLAARRYRAPTVDVAAVWSPGTACAAAAMPVRASHATRATPAVGPAIVPMRVDWRRPPPTARRDAGQPFRILHAGNFQGWRDYFPWVAETSDEYLAGVLALARVTAGVDDVETIIRVRPKDECDAVLVRTALPADSRAVVCANEQDFVTQLAGCDLMVCHFSTTAEQALQMRIPVLLWGSCHRFRQLPATLAPPSPAARSAVYAAVDETALATMLNAIVAAHRGRPLSAQEVAAYRWPDDAPGAVELARAVTTGRLADFATRHAVAGACDAVEARRTVG